MNTVITMVGPAIEENLGQTKGSEAASRSKRRYKVANKAPEERVTPKEDD
jgi:hypothetical protein